MRTHTTNSGEITPGVALTGAKTCFVFVTIQRGLSATYPAPILTVFQTKDVNRCPHAYTGKKISDFLHSEFYRSQNS